MIIIGCDYHPSFQQIAFVDTETGEVKEQRLVHREEAEKFYRDLAAQGRQVRVGMEARPGTLVRTTAGGVAVGVVGGRCRRDTA